jgi:predicted ribosome quality control (RQC) complex YloA/Tae2 family protein
MNHELNVRTYDNPNQAWIHFSDEKKQGLLFDQLFKICRQALDKRESFLLKTLRKIDEASNLAERKEAAERIGNLLLTHKHIIKPGSSKVVLKNIFSDTQENIEVKLDPRKNVADNARSYFEKYKNLDEKRFVMTTRRDGYEHELGIVSSLKEKLNTVSKVSELKKIQENLVDMKLIQEPGSGSITRTSLRYVFNRVILEKQWDIYIGKNGQNNDLLTFSFANKWDLWFHAQGVAGSHVIIHLETKDSTPPPEIILRTAQIAAANSKAQHSETVPVVYTRVKHVSRIRKAPPGTVKLAREEVLFVRPLKIG